MPPKDETPSQFWARWIANQGVPTVLLFCILASGWYFVRDQVPLHLQAIRDGYKQIEASHREEREERDKKFSEERGKDRELIRAIIGRPLGVAEQ